MHGGMPLAFCRMQPNLLPCQRQLRARAAELLHMLQIILDTRDGLHCASVEINNATSFSGLHPPPPPFKPTLELEWSTVLLQ